MNNRLALAVLILSSLMCGCAPLRTASFPDNDSVTQIVVKDSRMNSDTPRLHTIKDPQHVAAITTLLDNYKENWRPYRLVAPKGAEVELRMYHNNRIVQIVRWGSGELLTGINHAECHRPMSRADEKQLVAVLRLDGNDAEKEPATSEAVASKPTAPAMK